ncbi:hypothetical protein DFJ58DRAFT_796100 [Suillus subalutaceus]|uniref:uncharacterized protein n=1 Tax=Suillus subalutaceus TaxID=48586 RepID=UPI001B883749|nr:uncharacterized protein DFJ58DRAFT_796100 [Suillus subalutaceus]KAG1848505.1 hypothetical protein DFJ58DRAFT_796100 [Suillus subalutaceus]
MQVIQRRRLHIELYLCSLPVITRPDTVPPLWLSTKKIRQIIYLLLERNNRVVCFIIRAHRQDKHLPDGIHVLGGRTILFGLETHLDSQRINFDGPADMLESSHPEIVFGRRLESILRIVNVLSEINEPLVAEPETIVLLVTVPGWTREIELTRTRRESEWYEGWLGRLRFGNLQILHRLTEKFRCRHCDKFKVGLRGQVRFNR